ncbi:MAG: hypothetical protein ACYCVD_17475 [Desulfitobacteriaceae bacterium]
MNLAILALFGLVMVLIFTVSLLIQDKKKVFMMGFGISIKWFS